MSLRSEAKQVDYFPAFLNLEGRPCLLVGGGTVATRKAELLLAAGAKLTVVAPDLSPELARHLAAGRITHRGGRFRREYLDGQWLVVNATDDPDVAGEVFDAANDAGIFCNSVDDKARCTYITPAIIDRNPVVVAVSTGGAAPLLARKIRAQIEAVLPARLGRLAALAAEWRDRVRHRISDFLGRRRFWEEVFDGAVSDEMLAGRSQSARRGFVSLLEDSARLRKREGEAWLVGAGPGDPGLLTLRALQLMQRADVVIHDRLVSAEVLALVRRDAERISVGKSPDCKSPSQEEINNLLIRLVREGKRVCRLKGGDPFIFGRGGEEIEALSAAGLKYQVVPGITAAAGCAAYSGIPLTHRDVAQSVVFLTAHGKNSIDRLDWASLARDRQTLAIYMAVRRFPDIQRKLIQFGRSPGTPIAVIENGTGDNQRIIHGCLEELVDLGARHEVVAPSILIIGEVAEFGVGLEWFEGRPAPQRLEDRVGIAAG
jgi:uroporphyrin-III C-methyltransferase/precorrin-2 dehydrogenase/sirohydrochlorin ferrochelatase